MSAPMFPSPTFLPASITIQHSVWTPNAVNGVPVLDAHGNQTGTYAALVPRQIVCWWPLERRTWQVDPIDPDVVARYTYDIHMLVPQANVYQKLDRVVVEGLAYEIQGLATDWAAALPFPAAAYGMLIGGEVHCRRVSSTGVLGGM